MKLFPYTLIRLGGDSYEQWAHLTFDNTNKMVREAIALKKKKEKLKNDLCESLMAFTQNLKEQKEQNTIQNLRRDIYNNRKLKPSKLNAALELLDAGQTKMVNEFVDTISEIKALKEKAEKAYNADTEENRRKFQQLISSDLLQKGLILSSRSLLDRLKSYQERDVKSFRKKEFQTEQSLIKYLTRMYAKTSPFSTFTNLSIGKTGKLDDQPIAIKHKEGSDQVIGHIRLNNYLLKYIVDLFKSYRDAYQWLYLRPNPTVKNKQDHFLYLTNNNNIEAFQRIPFNPVVELILEVVKSEKEGLRFNDLSKALMEQIDAEASELDEYVKQLIDYGFLEYHIGVSGIDPDWDLKLVEKLKPLAENNVAHIDKLIATLTQLREMALEYATGDVGQRKKILTEGFEAFKDVCMKIHEAADLPEDERKSQEERVAEWKKKQEEDKKKVTTKGDTENKEDEAAKGEEAKKEEEVFKHETSTMFSFKPEQIFYEDTTREVDAILDEKQLSGFVDKLDEAMQALSLFRGMEDDKEKMKHYFLGKYGKEGKADLLTFYEDFYREFKKPEKEKEEKRKKEAMERAQKAREAREKGEAIKADDKKEEEPKEEQIKIDAIEKRSEKRKKWNEKYQEEIKDTLENSNGEIKLSFDAIEKTNEALGLNGTKPSANSYGCFAQFYQDEKTGKLKTVLNSSFSGYGKMISRFLHIFNSDVTESLRQWNTNLADDNSVFIEDCDASYFNANLHPPLMPYEIWMPGGHNTLPTEKQLPITDFEVLYNQDQGKLNLVHKPTGKNAFVFDLGFQGQMGRSQLFQLLERFTKAEYLFAQPLVNAVNSSLNQKGDGQKEPNATKEPKISISPRVVYGDEIILQRKSWMVPKPLIPTKQPMDTDWDYYLKVNEWRISQNMPDEVFIFINPNRWNTQIDPELTKRLTRDDYKPQYIDFTNPLLVNLFEKTIGKVPITLKVEEMLPSSKQLLSIDGQRFVSEFVVQWYRQPE